MVTSSRKARKEKWCRRTTSDRDRSIGFVYVSLSFLRFFLFSC